MVNSLIVYELDTWSWDLNTDFALGDCLVRAVKLTKYADKYSCSGRGFDLHSEFSLHDGSVGKNVITVGADMSSSAHRAS